MAGTLLAQLDAGFTWHGFWVNLLLQVVAAAIGDLIAVAGAFFIASRTFRQQVEHDFRIRREEDEARLEAAMALEANREFVTLEMLGVELAMNEEIGNANLGRSSPLQMPFRYAAFQQAMPNLRQLPVDLRLKVIKAYQLIDQFNSLIDTRGMTPDFLQRVLEAITAARKSLSDEVMIDPSLD